MMIRRREVSRVPVRGNAGLKKGSGEDGVPRPLLSLYEAPPSSFEKVERPMIL
jgi:hypothetical protein